MPRLEPTSSTKYKLLALSGNVCAFPDCNTSLVDTEGHLVGQFCHIEAAMPGGERFNPDQTDEERRSFEKLILLCANHHLITNDVERYDVGLLQQIKRTHEKVNADNPYNPLQVTLEEIHSAVSEAVKQSLPSSGFTPYGDIEYRADMEEAQNRFNNDMENVRVLSQGNQSVLQQASFKIKPKYDRLRAQHQQRKAASDRMYDLRLEELEEEFKERKQQGLDELNGRGMLHSGQRIVLQEKLEKEKARAKERLAIEFDKENIGQ